MNRITAYIGLPRSGKTTASLELLRADWGDQRPVIVSRDNIRLALHGKRFDASQENKVEYIHEQMMKNLLMNPNQHIILDETNCSIQAVRKIIQYDIEAKFIFVNTGQRTCVARARQTNQEYLIPIIYRMRLNLIRLVNYALTKEENYNPDEEVVLTEDHLYDSVEKIRQEVKEKRQAA